MLGEVLEVVFQVVLIVSCNSLSRCVVTLWVVLVAVG